MERRERAGMSERKREGDGREQHLERERGDGETESTNRGREVGGASERGAWRERDEER